VRVLDFRDAVRGAVEGRGGDDQDGGVDEKREHERHGRVNGRELDGLAFALGRRLILARLHDGRMEVEIVRHHRGAEDAHGDKKHRRIRDDLELGREAAEHRHDAGFGENDFRQETPADHHNERDDERLNVAKALVLKKHHEQYVERGDAHAPDQRDAEEQIQRDGRADDFREVARADGRFAEQPEHDGDGLGVMVPAGLGEVAPGDDAELGAERLQENRHEVRDQDDGEERVAELRTAREVGGPVAGIHVADGDEIARPGEGKHLAPEAELLRHRNGLMDFGQAGRVAGQPPALLFGSWRNSGRWIHGRGIHE
jgi:hypothetical protein